MYNFSGGFFSRLKELQFFFLHTRSFMGVLSFFPTRFKSETQPPCAVSSTYRLVFFLFFLFFFYIGHSLGGGRKPWSWVPTHKLVADGKCWECGFMSVKFDKRNLPSVLLSSSEAM